MFTDMDYVSSAARLANELMEYMQRNDVKPFRNLLMPLSQVNICHLRSNCIHYLS